MSFFNLALAHICIHFKMSQFIIRSTYEIKKGYGIVVSLLIILISHTDYFIRSVLNQVLMQNIHCRLQIFLRFEIKLYLI